MAHLTKRCSRCSDTLPVDSFGWKNKSLRIRRPDCRTCRTVCERGVQKQVNDRNRAIIRISKERRRAENIALIEAAKDRPCADCGGRFPSYVMDFDHVAGVKEGGISRMARTPVGEPKLLAEIAKCEVVCANCHRLRTFARIQISEADPKAVEQISVWVAD